jgi:hypothetical protein
MGDWEYLGQEMECVDLIEYGGDKPVVVGKVDGEVVSYEIELFGNEWEPTPRFI